jgi:hypothetical protein
VSQPGPTSSKPPSGPPPARPLPVALLVGVAAILVASLAAVLVLRNCMPSAPAPLPFPDASVETANETGDTSDSATIAPADDVTPAIRGRILDADGNPVVGAAVRAVSPSPPYSVFHEAKSDGLGTFSFLNLRPGTVRVVADHDPDGVVSSAELHVAEGQTTELTLVLSAAGAVRGRVVDADDHPVAGAVLSVDGVPWIVRSATSDQAGAFRMTTVPDEATSLVAVARGYRTERVPLPARSDQVETVVRVRLSAASPVGGDVLDVDGNAVKARVVACEGQPAEARTQSSDDGTFQLPASAIGCDAVAEHDQYAASDTVAVTEGRRLSLRLKPGGSIEGVVVDDRGAGVATFNVGIESFAPARGRGNRSGGRQHVEDPGGAFRMDKLAPGSYVLSVSAPGRAPSRSDPIDVAAGAATRGVRIALSQGGSVTGHVYDESHAPLAGVDLRFDSVSSAVDSNADAKTDDAGQYRIDGAPVGPFTLRVQKDGFRVRLLAGLRVDPHGTLVQDATLSAFDGRHGLEYGGIGATLVQTGDGIQFGDVFHGDAAERAGLRGGDRIVRVDGEGTDGMSTSDVLQRLRGPVGVSVGVTVLRPSTGQTLDFLVVRSAIVR